MTSTKVQILTLAERLIRTRGYHGFSYKDIAVQLHVKNAAVHYHFPNKEQLGVAVIDHNRKLFHQASNHWRALPFKQQLVHFTTIYTQSQAQGFVCIMGALGPAFEGLPLGIQCELTLMGEELLEWLEYTLRQGKQQGELQYNETPKEKALIWVNALLAALVTGRVLGQDYVHQVREGLLKGL